MKSNLRNIVMSLAMLFAAAGQAVAGHATAEMSTNAVTARVAASIPKELMGTEAIPSNIAPARAICTFCTCKVCESLSAFLGCFQCTRTLQ